MREWLLQKWTRSHYLPIVSTIYYPIVGVGPDPIVNGRNQGKKTAILKLCKVGGVNAYSDY